ncbi:hypothetical protein PHYPSEUDO_003563 [Phytophthora pseudosyringae]|uniref:Uncharacterized protein n=1 Tax=Phytophthora pseudosyringae TaxID=221518 RepID=A0A8T1VQD8_9STRA|nr:hypothetical protein PHYPSEUDO_003563 [Phytophthora pseudosyringae]
MTKASSLIFTPQRDGSSSYLSPEYGQARDAAELQPPLRRGAWPMAVTAACLEAYEKETQHKLWRLCHPWHVARVGCGQWAVGGGTRLQPHEQRYDGDT